MDRTPCRPRRHRGSGDPALFLDDDDDGGDGVGDSDEDDSPKMMMGR